MHLPSEMLNGAVCPVSAAAAAGGVALAAYALVRGKSKAPSAKMFALVSAAVFGLQMLNYPVTDGISGHLIGGAFAAVLLGVPAGILSLALVLTLQTLLFADGGLSMLGANTVNMALLGAGASGAVFYALKKRGCSFPLCVFFAGFLSVFTAVGALSVELAVSGKASADVIGTLLKTHLALAVVEGAFSAAFLTFVSTAERGRGISKKAVLSLSAIILVSLLAAPFASAFPDAFEWTMGQFSLLPDAPNFARAPFPEYEVSGIRSGIVSSMFAGFIGMFMTALLGFAAMHPLNRAAKVKE